MLAYLSMRAWPITLIAVACSSGPKGVPAPEEPAAPVAGEARERCLIAQEFEVQAWLNHAVIEGDETATWATLGMVMTLTEPAILEEMREVTPEAETALTSSAETWKMCRGVIAINCASLDQAAELTEVRIGSEVWDSDDLIARCAENRVDAEQADCVLAARNEAVARRCLQAPVAISDGV